MEDKKIKNLPSWILEEAMFQFNNWDFSKQGYRIGSLLREIWKAFQANTFHLKMYEIQPKKEIVVEFINNEYYK